MAGGRSRRFRVSALVFAIALGIYTVWGIATSWAPSRDDYAVQGVIVSAANGTPEWGKLGATGVDFAYITASEGALGRDVQFGANLEAVRQAGIRYGALHHFDICKLASDQAMLFMTTVPRSEQALPPAVQLDFTEDCSARPNRAFILSELATFLSQIESHSGTPAILLLGKKFEEEYKVSSAIDRTIWLESDWFLPNYSARPWVMWTANTARHVDGIEGPVRWAVVRK